MATTRSWTGNAQAQAQVETWAPGVQPPNTVATATINGKSASYTSANGTNDDLISGLITAIGKLPSGSAPEFNEITFAATAYSPAVAAPNATYLKMTAKTAGTPFEIGINLTTPAKVSVTRVQAGQAAINELQQITISPNAESGSAFNVYFNGYPTGNIPTPPSPPTFNAFVTSGALTGNYYYAVTFGTALGETEPSAASAQLAPSAQNVTLNIPIGPGVTTFRRVYRTLAGGAATGPYYLVHTIADNTTTTYTDSATDATIKLNAGPPATNGALQGALEALTSVGLGNVKVSGTGVAAVSGQTMPTSPIVYTVQFTGTLGGAAQPMLLALPQGMTILPTLTVTETQAGYPIQSEIQQLGWKQLYGATAPSGTFTITLPKIGGASYTTAPIQYNTSAATVQAAIVAAAPAPYANSFSVAAGPTNSTTQPQLWGLWNLTYRGLLANTDMPQATVDGTNLLAASGDTISAYYATMQPGSATGRNEIVTVAINNNPTGGTFGVTGTLANGNTISATGVAYNATAAALAAAFPSDTVNVSGNAGGPYTVEGVGEAGSQKVTFVASSSLTGASSLSGSVPTTNTAGVDPPVPSVVVGTTGGALASGTYYYKVTAVNGNGETNAHEVAAVVTGPDGNILLSWSTVSTATSYNIYRGTSPGGENLKIANVTTTAFQDFGGSSASNVPPTSNTAALPLPTGLQILSTFGQPAGGGQLIATYYWTVTATYSGGETRPSNEVSASFAANAYGSATLAWNAVSGATGYKVYRGISSGGEGVLAATITSASITEFTDSAPSNTAQSPPGSGPSPGGLQIFANVYAENDPFYTYEGFKAGFISGGNYYYKATAVGGSGESTASNEAIATITTAGQFVLIGATNWPAGTQTINFYRGTASGSENTLLASIPVSAASTGALFNTPGLSFVDAGGANTAASPPSTALTIAAPTATGISVQANEGALGAGTYYYKVTATTGLGETVPSAENLKTITANQVPIVGWTAETGADGYKIYRGTSAGNENVLVGVVNDGTATSFYDSGPTVTEASPPTSNTATIAAPTQTAPSTSSSGGNLPSATYYYKITAVTAAGETTGSNEQSIAVTGPSGQVTVNWNLDNGADGYKIYRGTTAGAENVLVATVGSSTATYTDYGTASAQITVTELTRGQAAASEIQTISLGGSIGGTYSLAFEGTGTAAIAYNATAATVQTDLQGLSTIGSGGITVTGIAGGPFTATFAGTLAGAPQPLIGANSTNLIGSTTTIQTLTTVAFSTGPNNWDNPANWSPAGVPQTGDTVVVQNNSVDILYGLAQSSITLANLQIDMSYVGGWIGLPNWNSNKYSEYRQQYLQIGVSGQVVIGNGKGSGPTLLKFDFGTSAFKMLVNGCGTNQDPTLPAILVKGNRSSGTSEIDIYKGKLGIAMFAGESATVDTIRQAYLTNKNSDTYVFVGQGVTLTTWYKNGGDGVLNTPVTTLRHELGTLTVVDGLVVTTITTCSLVGGMLTDRATGTITTLTVGTTASYDRTDDSRPKTITNTTIYGKSSFLDPHGSIIFTNPYTLSDCGYPDLVAFDLGTNITGTRTQI